MATLQIFNDGAWETFSGQPVYSGTVTYFRSTGHSAAAADATAAIPTAGAHRVVAYAGDINDAGTLTAGDLEVCAYGVQAATPTVSVIPFEQLHGATHSNGVLSTVATAVRAAYSLVCAAETSVRYTSPAGTTTDFDIVIEVHA